MASTTTTNSDTTNTVTHNGQFHADEVLAFALIFKFGSEKREYFNITRTRDVETIRNATLAIDVGGEYQSDSLNIYGGDYMSMYRYLRSHIRGRFDHHQHKGGKSSAGLIWDELTKEMECQCETGLMPFMHPIYDGEHHAVDLLVQIVDNHDTGVKSSLEHPFIKGVNELNDINIYSPKQDKNFEVSISFAIAYIESIVTNTPIVKGEWEELWEKNKSAKEAQKVLIKRTIKRAMNFETKGVEILQFKKGDCFVPTKEMIGLADLFIQWDEGQCCWTVGTIPLKDGEFGSKFKLSPTKRHSEVFTHKGGFIGKYKEESHLTCIDPYFSDGVVVKVEDVGDIVILIGEPYLV